VNVNLLSRIAGEMKRQRTKNEISRKEVGI
jgi:hypothetical protein